MNEKCRKQNTQKSKGEANAMKAATYARYSTDKQDATSISGQFANCESLADQNGWPIVEQYFDKAISGTDDSRPSYQNNIWLSNSQGNMAFCIPRIRTS